MLFWRDLSDKLKKWGFKINLYDWCVANKQIQGSQYTIVWHVNDLKILHRDPNAVTKIIEQLSNKYGGTTPLSITHGKAHDYLEMTSKYTDPGKVKIGMVKYVYELLEEMPSNMDGVAATPSAGHLFQINKRIQ